MVKSCESLLQNSYSRLHFYPFIFYIFLQDADLNNFRGFNIIEWKYWIIKNTETAKKYSNALKWLSIDR